MTIEHIIKRRENSFFEDLAIRSRFNPKEPIYGEENRQDLERLKIKFSSSIKEILEGVKIKISSDINSELIYAGKELASSGEMGARNVMLKRLRHDTINYIESIIKKL